MIRVNFKADIDRARNSLGLLQTEVTKGAARALDRVATTVRKEGSDEIRTRLKLSASAVKERINVVRPYGGQRLIRDVVASGLPIPLRDYSARQTRAGASYQVSTAKGRRVYRNKYGAGFIIPKLGGNVFVRVGPNPPGKAVAPIRKVYGPSIPQYFVTRFVRERMQRVGAERWPIEFNREMAYRASKATI
jgi:hypothetical protein